MTWQWVAIILGVVGIVAIRSIFAEWMHVKVMIEKERPKTIPDMLRSSKPDEQDTMIQEKWPEGEQDAG